MSYVIDARLYSFEQTTQKGHYGKTGKYELGNR